MFDSTQIDGQCFSDHSGNVNLLNPSKITPQTTIDENKHCHGFLLFLNGHLGPCYGDYTRSLRHAQFVRTCRLSFSSNLKCDQMVFEFCMLAMQFTLSNTKENSPTIVKNTLSKLFVMQLPRFVFY